MQSMKSLRILSFLAATLILTPALFAADFGIRGGRYDDIGEEFVGAEVLFDIGAVNINPNIEYALADDVTAGSANIDVTVDIGKFNRVTQPHRRRAVRPRLPQAVRAGEVLPHDRQRRGRLRPRPRLHRRPAVLISS